MVLIVFFGIGPMILQVKIDSLRNFCNFINIGFSSHLHGCLTEFFPHTYATQVEYVNQRIMWHGSCT